MLFRRLSIIALLATVSGCVSPSAPPPPPRSEPPPPLAPAPAPVVPATSDWRDWPLTPGDWSYAQDARGSTARYGRAGAAAELTLRCDRATRQVTFARRQLPGAAPALTVRTSSTMRALNVQPVGEGEVATTLAGNDSLFDAMGFSRGRFVVQQQGGGTLVAPSWAEILRVAEDCRG